MAGKGQRYLCIRVKNRMSTGHVLPVPPRAVPGTGSPGSSIAAATAVCILGIIIHGTGAVRVLVARPWIVEEVFPAGAVEITVACVLRCGNVTMLLTCHISTSGGVRVAGSPAANFAFTTAFTTISAICRFSSPPGGIVSLQPFFTGFKRCRVLRIRFPGHQVV